MHVFLDDFEIYKLPNSGRRHEKIIIISKLSAAEYMIAIFSFAFFYYKFNLTLTSFKNSSHPDILQLSFPEYLLS
jgi:hypothetical protein